MKLRNMLTPYGKKALDKTHKEWKNNFKLIKKIIESRILSKEENRNIITIYHGWICNYYNGNLFYADNLVKKLNLVR